MHFRSGGTKIEVAPRQAVARNSPPDCYILFVRLTSRSRRQKRTPPVGWCSFLSMSYEKDIFAVFAYEFELLRFLSEAQGFTLRDAMLSHRDVAHFVRSDVMFGATRQRRASRTAGLHHARSVYHLPERANIVEKTTGRNLSFFLVRVTGLEPASTRHWFLRPARLPFHHTRI